MKSSVSQYFLTKWFKNELTMNELEEFKNKPDYSLYEKIMQVSSELETPSFDSEAVFDKINTRITNKKTKVISLRWLYPVAASFLIALGAATYFYNGEVYETGFGEKMAVTLPDGSEVLLNAKSSLALNKVKWFFSRDLSLNGEAFFKVKKGEKFTVETSYANVKVLGTRFNVNTFNDELEVKCFEGKVNVSSSKINVDLIRGEAVKSNDVGVVKNWSISHEEPKWKNGEVDFEASPLIHVITCLENQYGIKINHSNVDTKQKFTGSITLVDLNIALATVFEPMSMNFKFLDKENLIISNK